MLKNRKQFLMWRRQVFVRNPHDELHVLYARARGSTGIYLIGCAHEIVYVGQSWKLQERPIESLGRYYHREPDVTLPWSLALAPCSPDEMDERESTAIRAFAPKFNTSIPSIPKSEGRMPDIVGVAAVFQDQDDTGGAFEDKNLAKQIAAAAENSSPPWRQGKQRKKTGPRPKPQHSLADFEPIRLTADEIKELWEHYGVPIDGELKFKINLCTDGSVITRDGEIIGTWTMDENEHPSFIPEGAKEPLIHDAWVGLLCQRVAEWYERENKTEIS